MKDIPNLVAFKKQLLESARIEFRRLFDSIEDSLIQLELSPLLDEREFNPHQSLNERVRLRLLEFKDSVVESYRLIEVAEIPDVSLKDSVAHFSLFEVETAVDAVKKKRILYFLLPVASLPPKKKVVSEFEGVVFRFNQCVKIEDQNCYFATTQNPFYLQKVGLELVSGGNFELDFGEFGAPDSSRMDFSEWTRLVERTPKVYKPKKRVRLLSVV